MPRTIKVGPDDVEWLRRAHETGLSYTEMASHIGACVDTTKRILVRHGIAEFDAAKYVIARRHTDQFWTRPCMKCGSKQKRPRNLYLCDRCREGDD